MASPLPSERPVETGTIAWHALLLHQFASPLIYVLLAAGLVAVLPGSGRRSAGSRSR